MKELWGAMSFLSAMFVILIVAPAWYVILYNILSATDQPAWVWGVFWAYVPAGLIGGGVMKFCELMKTKYEEN